MMSFLQWLESSAFSSWLKESPSLLAYPAVLFLHAVGLVCTAGPSTVISLRLLGVGRQLPLTPLANVVSVPTIPAAPRVLEVVSPLPNLIRVDPAARP